MRFAIPQFPHSTPSDEEILILWRGGMNTNDIGKKLFVPESHIAARLPRILEQVRNDCEWGKEASQAAE